jgi:hypothetical protein
MGVNGCVIDNIEPDGDVIKACTSETWSSGGDLGSFRKLI